MIRSALWLLGGFSGALGAATPTADSGSATDADADASPPPDDGLVFLPRASPGLQVLCVAAYLSLALVAACRALSLLSSRQTPGFQRSRRSTFQRLMVLFALTRAASFLGAGTSRNLLNRAALCFFFSLVLFQVLFWIDIANPKISRRSRRIWVAFVLANGVFYALVLGLSAVHEAQVVQAEHERAQLKRSTLWTGVLPVLLVALGSFVSSLGLVYSTWKMRHRVARVLRPTGDGLRRRVDERVERKLTRALRFTILVMTLCSLLFLARTLIYIQRPFSHQGCGDIHSADVCVVVGYAIPEVVPCALFLVLMWEVEPNLQFPSRRSLSFNNGMVTSETTPLLRDDALARPLLVQTEQQQPTDPGVMARLPNSPPGAQGGYLASGRRPSPLSLGLGGGVLDRAKRRLELVVRQHLGVGRKELHASPTIDQAATCHFTTTKSSPPAVGDRRGRYSERVTPDERQWTSGSSLPTRLPTPAAPYAWLSFQCFNLNLPARPAHASSSFVVLDLMDAETGAVLMEIGRTEISASEDPIFHLMLAVEMREQDLLRASVYSVRNPSTVEDLNSQWLVGDPLVPLSAFMAGPTVKVGRASIYSLYSPLSRTQSSGELVVRCEAEVKGTIGANAPEGRLERITRSFLYIGTDGADIHEASAPLDLGYSEIAQQMIELASTSQRAQGKMLVEEELIESVYTWEVPYQLLQLILSDLLVKLDSLKREIALEEENGSSSSTPSSQISTPSVGGSTMPSVSLTSPGALNAVPESEVGNTTLSSEEAGSLPTSSGMMSPRHTEVRTRSTASIGMLSEMIIQIQDDAVERKKRKWRMDLINTMEEYISEVEDSILRYGATQHAGLTFKPSTMKADADLRFLALNLHQQLMTVGNAAPTSESDVQQGNQSRASLYAQLVNSFVGTFLSSPVHVSRESSVHGPQTDLDAVHSMDYDYDFADENEAEQPPSSEEVPLEPVEALRRRVISFGSAETIVNMGSEGQDVAVPSEQRKLAETIVAMGITEEEFQSIYGIDDTVNPSPNASFITVETQPNGAEADLESGKGMEGGTRSVPAVVDATKEELKKSAIKIDTTTRSRSYAPFQKHRMYGTTTVGAFAAHVYGFKTGGVRQMREELERLHGRLVREAETASSELTMDALERKYNELKWDVERRLEVAFSQSMSALVTCFQQTLYVHTHDHQDFGPHALKARGIDYLAMVSSVGFLFSVESLLSTYSKELGMLGDTEAAVKELARVQIKLRPVKTPRAAAFRVSITSGPSGIIIELPIITRRANEFPDRSMHRVPGQDAFSGAIYLPLSTSEQKHRAKRLFQKPIRVVPVLFSQGMNEMQTVANTVGRDSLQKEINAENVVELEAYVDRFMEWCSMQEEGKNGSTTSSHTLYDPSDLDRIQSALTALKISIQLSGRSKRMAILSLSSSIARAVGGGRVTMCKSAKDRTSMSITLEEANLLMRSHGLIADELVPFTNLLRAYGVRRENARKNIGKAQYCFSALQNYMLPQDYQCPPGTGGGSRSFS